MTAGYSGTPLYKKLGLKPGLEVYVFKMPVEVRQLIEDGVKGIVWSERTGYVEAAHLFVKSFADLEVQLARVRKTLKPSGFIWVSWPKKASGVITDVTEDRIRELAISLKLVDVKVCAVTQIWSALKLVIRVKDRT